MDKITWGVYWVSIENAPFVDIECTAMSAIRKRRNMDATHNDVSRPDRQPVSEIYLLPTVIIIITVE